MGMMFLKLYLNDFSLKMLGMDLLSFVVERFGMKGKLIKKPSRKEEN